MPIPDYQTIMLPLLKHVEDKEEHSFRETVEELANNFKLSGKERQKLLPSGVQAIFDNRVGWAKTHLLKAGLLEQPRRSIFKITERGLQILRQNISFINVSFLKKYPEYLEFIRPNNEDSKLDTIHVDEKIQSTPEEILENAYLNIRNNLGQELLTKIKTAPPSFFERLVVELLVKMGYGGSLKDAGEATQPTNDDGIDGIIKEDKLGLDVIYIQAKRWNDQPVGRPALQSFVGALDGKRANKGIFITTSHFSKSAIEYVETTSKKVILIDGEQLTNFMIDYGLGVTTLAIYELKKIDNDYFGE